MQNELKPNLHGKDSIPVLRLDKRITDMRDGQIPLQVLILQTGFIVSSQFICENTKHRCLWWFTPALCNFCAKNTAKRWDSLTDDPLHHVIHLSSFLLFFAPSVFHVIHQTQNYTDAYREMQERLVKTLRSSPCRKHQLLQKVEANLQGRRELCGSQWRRRVWGDRRRSCGGGWTPVVRFPIRPLWVEQGRHQSTCQETNTPQWTQENGTHRVILNVWMLHLDISTDR